jgi:hypothetical protein
VGVWKEIFIFKHKEPPDSRNNVLEKKKPIEKLEEEIEK